MWKGRYIWNQMMEQTAQGADGVLRQTIVEISGSNRVLIEDHCGICAYGKNEITVKVKYGSVSVCGDFLEIIHLTQDHLVIMGAIRSVTLQRREKT